MKFIRIIIKPFLLILIIMACQKTESNMIELVPKEIIANLTDSTYLNDVRNLRIKNNDIYLVDNEANRIIILDTLKNVIKTFGRYGAGPGEFIGVTNIQFFKDSLFAISVANKKMNIFDTSGVFIRTFHLPPQVMSSTKFVIDEFENFYFSTPTDKNYPIYKVDKNGNLIKGFGAWNLFLNKKEKRVKNVKDLIKYDDKIISFTHGSPQIEIFSFEGNLIDKFSIEENYYIKKRLIFVKKEITKSESNKLATYRLIRDASLYNNNLYLLIYDFNNTDDTGSNKLLKINMKTKKISSTFFLKSHKWYRSFLIYKNKIYAFTASTAEIQIFEINNELD